MAHTLVEKILLAHCDADDVRPGDVVTVRCDVVMANDVSGPVAFRAMEKMGAARVFDPSRVVMVADHFMPAKDVKSAELQGRLSAGRTSRASRSTARAAAASSTRCSARRAGSCPAP